MRPIWVVVVMGACFRPSPPSGAPCGSGSECPDPLECIAGMCLDPSVLRIDFAAEATLVDEASGTVSVHVVLNEPSEAPVSASYAFADGSATTGVDYAAANGTLTFEPGETDKEIAVAIVADAIEEVDESFQIALRDVAGADVGASTHTVTINANLLPRIGMSVPASSGSEGAATALEVVLDPAPAIETTVEYTVAGTATSVDHGLAAGTLTFAPGVSQMPLDLALVDDVLDEDDETVVVTLVNPVNAFLGETPAQTHTIADDDAMPSVGFTVATPAAGEVAATHAILVALSAPSGRNVTVPFAVGATTTAAAGVDFSLAPASPLVFPPGTTMQAIDVTVLADAADEPNELVGLELGAPINATLGEGSCTFTINDDDLACYGAGTSRVCFDRAPTAPVVLPALLDTTTSALCAPTQAVGWTGAGQPEACFVVGTTVTSSGTTTVTGSRPLVLVGSSSVTIGGLLDAAGHLGGGGGPGSPSAACLAFTDIPEEGNGGGGGAGGTFRSRGGEGADGDDDGTGLNDGGNAPDPGPSPLVLRAGCDGQAGGSDGQGVLAGAVGRGGGAVYLVAGSSISLAAGAVINASGAGASGGGLRSGGSGGGSGGMIQLHAPSITASGATLMANGGGGASGGDSTLLGNPGADPDVTAPLVRAQGGSGGGGGGGDGDADGAGASAGSDGGNSNGGGGGGGGGGLIRTNLVLTGATMTAGAIEVP